MLHNLPWCFVLAVLGAPRIGVSRAFSAFLEAKKGLFGKSFEFISKFSIKLNLTLRNWIILLNSNKYFSEKLI